MSLFINTNVASLVAQNNLNNSQGGLQSALQRLSSGLRINSAADDAAGLAISTRMSSQINGFNQASQNANDGISLAQTAGGALSSVTANLQTLRQLAVESANATNTSSDRQALNAQAQQLLAEIQNTAVTTQFNGQNLLDGTFQAEQFQVGANANQTISVNVAGATTNSLGDTTIAGTAVNGAVSGAASTAAVDTATWSAAAGTISINGVNIGESVGATSATDPAINAGVFASSAAAMAAAINAQSGVTGVSASATTTVTGGVMAAGNATALTSGEFWINGIAVGAIAASTDAQTQLQNAATAINNVSQQSGVTATIDLSAGTLKLTAANGANIDLSATATSAAAITATTGLTALTNGNIAADLITTGANAGNLGAGYESGGGALTQGTLTLTSNGGAINLTDSNGGTSLTAGGIGGTATPTTTFNSLASLDISTVAGANSAINIVDAAINQIDGEQANLGAVQNRFTATIGNLNTASTNLSSAQSLIEDTNYASETASLAHYQILQQAGTAMLAQANALPNSVLTLLR